MRVARAGLMLSLVLGSGAVASGAGLTVDGQTSITSTMGETVQVTITGSPNDPAYLLADVLPGPTTVFGQSLPLGFSVFVQVVPLPPLDGSGQLTLPVTVPTLSSLDGQTIYLLAVVLDDASPIGLDFSNGADITVVSPPVAGADQATLVGRRVLLDGSAAALPGGTAKPGTTVTWQLTQTPPGSAAIVSNPTQPFATLVPDRPGDYLAQLTVQTPTASYVSDTRIHAWRVDTAPVSDGGIILLSSYGLTGTVVGPPVASLTYEEQAVAVDAGGGFGPLPVVIPPGEAGTRLRFRITHADGTTANHHMTVFQGLPTPFDSPSPKSLHARLGPAGLAEVGDLGEQTLQEVDLKGILLALPPQLIADDEGPFGFTIFSATIDFDDLTYHPDIQLDLTPTADGIQGVVTIQNVKADFSVYGEVLEIDYDLDGYITTSPTTISATLVGTANNGLLDVAVTDIDVDRANFDFELTGFIGSVAELFVIESSVKEQVEQTIADTIEAELGPGIEEILNAFVLAGSLSEVLDVDVSIAAPISGVVHDASGVTIELDGIATVGVPEPGTPDVTHFRGTPALAPTFGPLTQSGAPYDAALAFADDFVNQVLAAGTKAGLMDGDLTSLFPSDGGTPIDLPTDQLALIFPDSGFDHFPDGTAVRLQAHGTVPPLLCLTPGEMTMGDVRMDNLEVEFEVDTPYGPLPMLLVSVNGLAGVDISAGADGTLELELMGSDLSIEVLRIFPGAKPRPSSISRSASSARSSTSRSPSWSTRSAASRCRRSRRRGLGLVTQEAGLLQGSGYVGLWGDLLVAPPGKLIPSTPAATLEERSRLSRGAPRLMDRRRSAGGIRPVICEEDCDCPDGHSCEMMQDKATSWMQCNPM